MEKPGSDVISDYEKAIELNPEYFEAQYSIGAYYYNVANRLLKESNTTDDNKEANEISKLAKVEYRKSMAAFEKTLELKQNSPEAKKALKTIYAHLDMTEKYMSMKEKLADQ